MATVFLRVPVDFDVAGLKTGKREVNEFKKEALDLQRSLKPGQPYKIAALEIEASDAGFVEVKEGIKTVEALDKAERKLSRSIDQVTKTQKGSLTSIRQEIAARQQQLNGLNRADEGYQALEDSIKELKAESLAAQGVTRGSTRYLQDQLSTLKANANATFQTAESLDSYRRSVSNLNEGLRRQQGIQKGSKADLEAIRSELIQGRNAIDRFADPKKFRELSIQIGAVEDRLDAFQSAGQRLTKLVDAIGRIQVAFNAVGQVIQTVNQVINTFVNRTKQVESFTLALQNVGLGLDEVNASFNQAYETASALGAPLQSVEKSYKRMIPSLISIGATAEESDRFIEALSARTQTLGLNAEQSGRLIEAFAQVLSKGKLQGEELNQQISELDGSFRSQFAQAIGIATDELSELVETGGVSSSVFVRGVLRMENGVEALRDRIEDGNETIQQLQNQINNIKTKNIEELAKAFDPLFRAILAAQVAFEEFIKQLTASDLVRNLTVAIVELGKGIGLVIAAFGFLVGVVEKIISPIVNLLSNIDKIAHIFSWAANAVGFLVGSLTALFIISKLPGLFSTLTAEVFKLGIAAAGSSAKTLGLVRALALIRRGQFLRAFQALGAGIKRFTGQLKGQALGAIKAAGGLKAMAASALAAAAPFAALAAGIGGITYAVNITLTSYNKYNEGLKVSIDLQREAAAAAEELADKQGKVKPPPNFLQRIGSNIGNSASLFFDNYNQGLIAAAKNLEGFLDGIDKVSANTTKLTQNLAEEGSQLRANSDLTKLSNDQVAQSTALQTKAANIIKKSIDLVKQQIASTEVNNVEDKQRVDILKQKLQQLETELGMADKTVEALTEEAARRGINTAALLSTADAIEVLRQENARLLNQQKQLNLQGEAESYKRLTDGVYSTAEAEAYRAATVATGETAILNNLEEQRNKYTELQAEGKKLTVQQKKDLDDINKKIVQQTITQSQAYKKVGDSIVDAFERGIKENQKLADVAIKVSNQIKGAFESIASAGTSGIQAGLSVVGAISSGIQSDIDRSASRQLDAISKAGLSAEQAAVAQASIQAAADAAKAEVLRKELILRRQMADIEYEIESVRLEVATRVQIIEAQIAKQRLQAEAQIAKARGEDDMAAALERSAQFQDILIKGIQFEAGLQKEILGFKRDQEKASIAAQAASAGIGGFAVAPLETAIGRVQRFADSARNASFEFADLAVQTAEYGKNLDSKSVENGLSEAEKVKGAIFDAANSAEKMSGLFEASATHMRQIAEDSVQLLKNISSLNSFNPNARAMGGPVSAGSQYTINDGGGREAFMNKFGRLSMLPVGRNLQWTAPTSGTIIPAHLVSDYLSNARAKQISSVTTRNQFNNGVSGNLITHASTNSSRSFANASSRIVNNVTIQSQNPVADASMLMIQAQKIKSRRRR